MNLGEIEIDEYVVNFQFIKKKINIRPITSANVME